MSQEPNNVEQLLRRYSKERREQAGGFTLHPATRNLLQGEVARELGGKKGGAAPPAQSSFSIWRGPVLASAFVLILGAGLCVLLLNRGNSGHMEMAKAGDREERSVAAAPRDFLEDETRATDALKKLEDRPAPAARPDVALKRAAPASPSPVLSRSRDMAEKSFRENESVTTPASSAGVAPAPAPVPKATAPVERYAMKGASGPAPERQTALAAASAANQQQQVRLAEQKQQTILAGTQNVEARFMKQAAQQQELRAEVGAIAQNADALQTPALGQSALNSQAPQMQNSSLFYSQLDPTNQRATSQRGVARSTPTRAPVQEQMLGNNTAPAESLLQNNTIQEQNALANNQLAGQKLAEQMQRRDRSAAAVAPESNNGALNFAPQMAANAPAPQDAYRRLETVGGFAGGGAMLRLETDDAKAKSSQPGGGAGEQVVLNRFNISQTGQTVRLTDSDGSVYEGPIVEDSSTNAVALAKESLDKRELPQYFDAADVQRLPMRFKAVGTNRTLQQRVQIDARLPRLSRPASFGFEPPVEAPQRKATDKDVALQLVPPTSSFPSTTPTGGTRMQRLLVRTNGPVVEGTVQVGQSAGRRFRAVSVDNQ
jgi:hypothetical protein